MIMPSQPCVAAIDADRPAPLVSVIIPCYRQAHYLADAIESLLNQTYPRVEILVVDDGSPDDTAAVARRYPVVYVRRLNGGLSAARNTGLSQASGGLVVFLDADDRMLPNGLQRNASLLVADPRLGFAGGHSHYITADGATIPSAAREWPSGDAYTALLLRNRIRMPGMVMFPRRVLDEIGGFDSAVDACGDYDLYLRVSRRFPIVFHDDVIAEYRRHDTNMSRDPTLMLRQLTHVVRRQRPFVQDDPVRRAALEAGLRNMQDYYGDQIADRIRACVRGGRGLGAAGLDALQLLRLNPRGFAVHVLRRGRRTLTRRPDHLQRHKR